MLANLRNRLQFLLERFLVRGAGYRLAFVIAAVVTTSLLGGVAVVGTGEFEGLSDAMWWAFLRLSDPGYLGDDHGTYVRTVSTLLTVAGYVLFLGALIAIMTQWLQAALRRLENGLTPIADRNHIVVLGWTNRTATIVRELLLSTEQVRLFLRLRGRRSLSVVVLAEEVDAELQQELRDRVGEGWRTQSVVLRSGTSLRPEHLRRVAADEAAALILPAPLFDTPRVSPDTETIKTLLSLATLQEDIEAADLPLVVAELLDARRLVTARGAYPGPLEVVASHALVSSLICQTIRHPGISHVFSDLLAYGEGSEIYVRSAPSLSGLRFGDLADAFPNAIMLGVVRHEPQGPRPLLNPSDDLVLQTEDLIVFIAEDYEGTTPPPESYTPQRPDYGEGVPPAPFLRSHRRVLILGWSQLVPSVFAELERYRVERFEVTVGSFVSTAARQRLLDEYDFVPERITLQHVELDYTIPGKLRRLAPEGFDNIVFMASDRIETDETDARTIVGHLLLRELVPYTDEGPRVLVELTEVENLDSLPPQGSEIMVPPLMLSHIMAQIALRSELRVVFEDLFGAEGPEIFFRPVREYPLAEREVSFAEIARAAAARNETALGMRLRDRTGHGDDEILVNPPRDRQWTLHEDDELVVLTTYTVQE